MDKLTEILASDLLNVPKEEMVFEAVMLWLNKSPTRKQSFEKVSLSFNFDKLNFCAATVNGFIFFFFALSYLFYVCSPCYCNFFIVMWKKLLKLSINLGIV